MPLTVGSSLGHYDVTALIGEGAWGRSIGPTTRCVGVRLGSGPTRWFRSWL